jgi:CBS domain
LMLLVRDVMRRQVYGIAANDAIVDAAREMVLRSVDSLLVVDGDLLLGIVTERDVLRAALPSVGELMQDESWADLRDLVGVASGHFGVPVRMIMTIHVVTTTPLTEALGQHDGAGLPTASGGRAGDWGGPRNHWPAGRPGSLGPGGSGGRQPAKRPHRRRELTPSANPQRADRTSVGSGCGKCLAKRWPTP